MKAGSRIWLINTIIWLANISMDRIDGVEIELYKVIAFVICFIIFVLLGYTDND